MSDIVWYIARGSKTHGPVQPEKMQLLVREGHLKPEDLVWKSGMENWARASEMPGLFQPPEVPKTAHAPEPSGAATGPLSGAQYAGTGKPAGNYFVRHWRGQLSLPVSYWVNVVLVTVLLWVAVYLIPLIKIKIENVYLILAVFTVLVLCSAGLMLWQYRGVWRSAGAYMAQRKKSWWVVWGGIARVMVVLGAMSGVFQLYKLSLIGNVLVQIATGTDASSKRSFTVLQNGKELALNGGISFGVTKEVESYLEKNPDIKILRLDSTGGRVGPARKLRDLVRDRGLITYTAKGCYSACTIPFIAGKVRVMHTKAKLGFHQTKLDGLSRKEIKRSEDKDRKYFASKGVPAWFLDKAYSTPWKTMWFPSKQELLEAKFIDRVTDGQDYGIDVGKTFDGEALELTLLQHKNIRIIKEYMPDFYNKLLKEIQEAVAEGKSFDEMAVRMHGIIGAQVGKLFATAPDTAIRDYVKVRVARIRTLAKKRPGLCYKFLFPRKYGRIAVRDHFPKEEIEHERAMMAELIKQANVSPAATPTNADIREDFIALLKALKAKHGKNAILFLRPPGYGAPKMKEYCLVVADMYESIVNLPETKGGPILRFLYKGRTKKPAQAAGTQ